MILILTKSLLEINSDIVTDWLTHFNAESIVITGDEFLDKTAMSLHITDTAHELKIRTDKNGSLPLDQIKTVWFRRRMEEASFQFYENLNIDLQGKQDLLGHIKVEFLRFYSILPVYLKNAYWLCHPDRSSLNKLEILLLAKMHGLTIPETIVTNFIDASDKNILNQEETYISKPLSETSIIAEETRRYSMLTKVVDQTQLPENTFIFPSLLQKCIEKEFEIRTFYLSGKCYSMAIFSQENEKTKTDSNGAFTIQATMPGNYSIVNELGQIVERIQLNTANNYTVFINNLSNGSYYITGLNDNQFVRQKIIILQP